MRQLDVCPKIFRSSTHPVEAFERIAAKLHIYVASVMRINSFKCTLQLFNISVVVLFRYFVTLLLQIKQYDLKTIIYESH